MRRTTNGLAYALMPLAGMLIPLLALPAVTSAHGASGWAAVAVGQSIGLASATVVELGWGLNGPQRVARMNAASSYRAGILALQMKAIAFIPLGGMSFAIAAALSSSSPWDAGWAALGACAAGLSMSWLFLGRSTPWAIVATETVLRLLGMLTAALLMLHGGDLWVFGVVGLLVPNIAGPLCGLVVVRSRASRSPVSIPRLREVRWAMRSQSYAVSARLASSLYLALPVALVSVTAPQAVPVFAAGERLMRLGLTALAIVPSAMQGWIGRAQSKEARIARSQKAILLNAVLGALAGIGFGLLAPPLSVYLFSGVATLPPELAWIFAVVVLVVSISRATGGLALVAARRVDVIATSAGVGAVVGVPGILIGASCFGALGGVIGEVVAETSVLAIQLRGLRRAWRR